MPHKAAKPLLNVEWQCLHPPDRHTTPRITCNAEVVVLGQLPGSAQGGIKGLTGALIRRQPDK